MRLAAAVLLALISCASALAADPVADPASPVGKVGATILQQTAGRDYRTAYAASRNDYDPYGIRTDALLAASGATAFSDDGTGKAIAEGEFHILPQFNTPGGKFSATADTPALFPFAFLVGGVCHAGYVAGDPAPETTFEVDLTGKPCSAYSVADIVWDEYRAIQAAIDAAPKPLDDAGLDLAVRAAYAAAAAHSSANGNYFSRDGAYVPLRDAVAAELARQDLGAVTVPPEPAASLDAASACLAKPGTELRIALNATGDGLSLVAVTDRRVLSWHYDPHESAQIVVGAAADCT
jgi:hypothetical protein